MNYLDYKKCQYYKKAEEQEHCPFSVTCKDDCIFSLLYINDAYDTLEKENDELLHELNCREDQADELHEAKDRISVLESKLFDTYWLLYNDLPDWLLNNEQEMLIFPDFLESLELDRSQAEQLKEVYTEIRKKIKANKNKTEVENEEDDDDDDE